MLTYQQLTEAQQDAIDAWWTTVERNDYENIDNHRFAIQGNPEQESDYERLRSHGCCGYVDVELQFDGGVLLYGFNYGH
jgi:hypothetical protein